MKLNKKVAAGLAAGAVMVAGGGVAYAYFTDTGSGNGSVTVGSSAPWDVSGFGTTGSSVIAPGTGLETVSYTITNNGAGDQKINSITVTVAADTNGDVLTDATDSGSAVTDCKASWFHIDDTNKGALATLGTDAGNKSENGSVDVTMPSDNEIQDACQGVSPAIHVAVA